MPVGFTVNASGSKAGHLYFPTTSVVALVNVMTDGACVAIALTGNDGLVGVSLFMGGDSTPSGAVVACGGQGFRLQAAASKREFALGGAVQRIALRFIQALITQTAQTALCNRHHGIRQQLCRLLLLGLDRLPGNELPLTQERIAGMLGVRREGVTEAALQLRSERLIRYSRGRISVLDRPGIERRACECYGVVKREYDRLLGR